MAGSNAKADEPVFYEHLSATYLHFVLVQAAGLMFAVIAKADVGRVAFAWIAANWVEVEKAHDVFRFAGLILAGLAFFPSALAMTNAVAAALVINSVIGLYVKLWHTAPIVDASVREKTEV
ncbi:MAG: hypothetical protein IAI50_19140 [Candidatus Eremiobacteraeota bacterium]|nr:hypothetical protein [Candidatus Eremiobacteraeota bacterium]